MRRGGRGELQDPGGSTKDKKVKLLAGAQSDGRGKRATEKVEAREGGEAEHQQRMLSREERKAKGLEEGLVVLDFV